MSTAKIRRSREEWNILLSSYDRSGLSQEEFCKQHGLGISTLTSQLSKRRGGTSFVAVGVPRVAVAAVESVSIEFPSGLRLTVGR